MPICYPWSTFPTLKPLVVASNSLNHTEHPSVSAPGRHSLQLSPFWTKASAAPLLWSVKKTWCGWMQKNSITNRAHLHNFHQPILSCQKGLLLIGLEGKWKEESVEDGIGSWGPLNAHVWLIKVEGGFFLPPNFALLRAAELTRSASWLRYKQDKEGNMKRESAAVHVRVPEVRMHLIILIWGHNTGSNGRCMRINLSVLNMWGGHAVSCYWPECGFAS